ncbi:MAG: SH3 domain-containing protein [Cyanobacteriota bacterium]|nr:SH3 domain-containing protein [Cyanobacteriota bacterium]
MKLKQVLLTITTAITLCAATALPGLAASAQLRANDPGAYVNIRTAPTTESSAPHYGLPGDWVEILDSSVGEGGYVWFYVKFYESEATGWVREDFLSFQ